MMDIQMLLIPQQLKTYPQILTIAREVERVLEKNQTQIETRQLKRPFSQMGRGNPVRLIGAPPAKQPYQPPLLPLVSGTVRSPDVPGRTVEWPLGYVSHVDLVTTR